MKGAVDVGLRGPEGMLRRDSEAGKYVLDYFNKSDVNFRDSVTVMTILMISHYKDASVS